MFFRCVSHICPLVRSFSPFELLLPPSSLMLGGSVVIESGLMPLAGPLAGRLARLGRLGTPLLRRSAWSHKRRRRGAGSKPLSKGTSLEQTWDSDPNVRRQSERYKKPMDWWGCYIHPLKYRSKRVCTKLLSPSSAQGAKETS